MNYSEELYSYCLSKALQLEPLAARAIVDNLGSAAAFFELSPSGKDDLIGPYNRLKDKLLSADPQKDELEFRHLLSSGCRYICHSNPLFPGALDVCEDAPLGLFVRSDDTVENIFREPRISIVGTRDLSSYGMQWCERIVQSLSECREKPTIVSGLAFGVDITAHKKALECKLPTIAILGTGITHIYPAQNNYIAQKMLHEEGCAIISEYGTGLPSIPTSFLYRNRIIAALSESTLLIESKIKGGGMTTARLAASYNRNVFALVGRIDDIRSQGCNILINNNIAAPIIGCNELVDALGYKHAKERETKPVDIVAYYEGCMDRNQITEIVKIMEVIATQRDIQTRDIARITGLPFNDILILTTRLESDGFIAKDMFQRCCIRRK